MFVSCCRWGGNYGINYALKAYEADKKGGKVRSCFVLDLLLNLEFDCR